METYILIDVSKKQEFIFKNNELKKNIYNSLVIKAVTEDIQGKEEELDFLQIRLTNKLNELEKESSECIFSGGGNSIIRFKDKEKATSFIECYSKEVLIKYPELELYISRFTPQNEEERGYQYVRNRLHALADQQKDARKSQFKRLSYGVEQINEVGRPVDFNESKGQKEVNKQEKPKKDKFIEAKEYFKRNFTEKIKVHKGDIESKIEITYELDDYRKKGSKKDGEDNNTTKSYMGVISIDGNKMGDIIKKIKDFRTMREVGGEIDTLYSAAIAEAISKIVEKSEDPLKITPIVFAGDDICIITEAEKSIALAAEILKQIEVLSKDEKFKDSYKNLSKLMKEIEIDKLTACGGASIVKIGYPFFEAVGLAEDMCKNAKVYTHKLATNASFLDWSVIKGGKGETQDYLSFVEDNDKKSVFGIKPLLVEDDGEKRNFYINDVFTYQGFKQVLEYIIEIMKEKDSKLTSSGLQKIKEAMYLGEARYKMQIKAHKINLKSIFEKCTSKEVLADIEEGVFQKGKKNIYLLRDVIEALEFWD